MTSIAEFTLPAASFPLGRVFEGKPGARLELDRVVPAADTVMPYFWVCDSTEDLSGALAVFEGLPELRSVALLEDLGDQGLFRTEWNPDSLGIMRAVAETSVTVLSGTGTSDGWTFELRAESVERFSAFRAYCDDHGVDVSLARLSHLSEMRTATEYGLTPAQREALVLAYREGYYDEPRGTDQTALAAELSISRQALAARLRRGYRNLVENTVLRADHDGA